MEKADARKKVESELVEVKKVRKERKREEKVYSASASKLSCWSGWTLLSWLSPPMPMLFAPFLCPLYC